MLMLRFNSKNGSIDSYDGAQTAIEGFRFNSKNGSIDSLYKALNPCSELKCFNSKNGSIDRFLMPGQTGTLLHVSIPKMVRLIVPTKGIKNSRSPVSIPKMVRLIETPERMLSGQ